MKESAKMGYVLGLIGAVFILLLITIPEREQWHALGEANPGHEDLACTDCHTPAEGTMRQQLQANARAFFGFRDSGVTFGFEDVTNDNCLACHARPNDRHPVFRFLESRFVEARAAIAPQYCESCHLEHQGERVSIEPTYCVYCHTDLDLRDDPLDVPHVELVATEAWETCLQSHDYHGNHIMATPTTQEDMISLQAVEDYFADGPSPYSDRRLYNAKETLDE
jgi:hypothetical protein